MGCDIHSYAEVRVGEKWEPSAAVFELDEYDRERLKETHGIHPFDWRRYGMFGFLADVRNYSRVPCVAPCKYAIPDDASELVKAEYEGWGGDAHSATWLTLQQLLDVNYEQTIWDRRVTKQTSPNFWDGAALAEEGEGKHESLREFLGEGFFKDLESLKTLGSPENVRVIMWFDN